MITDVTQMVRSTFIFVELSMKIETKVRSTEILFVYSYGAMHLLKHLSAISTNIKVLRTYS